MVSFLWGFYLLKNLLWYYEERLKLFSLWLSREIKVMKDNKKWRIIFDRVIFNGLEWVDMSGFELDFVIRKGMIRIISKM